MLFFVKRSIVLVLVTAVGVCFGHAGGILSFGTGMVKTSGGASVEGIPIDLALGADSPLAALQFSVVASDPYVRLTKAFRGDLFADAAKWGFGYNVLPGRSGHGDTLIVLVWSRSLAPVLAGQHYGMIRIACQAESTEPAPVSCTLSLEGVVAALADGKSSPGFVVTGTSREITVQVTPPSSFALSQNYPNPFNPSTQIRFTVPEAGRVVLSVYDIAGRLVLEPLNGHVSGGTHSVEIDGSSLPSGTYVFQVCGEGIKASRKMLLVR